MAGECKTVRLGELSEIITKGTTPTTLGYRFTDSGINFVKSESVTFNGWIDCSKFAFIDEQTHEALKRSQLQEGDILFSMAGFFIGKTAVVPKTILPANTNQAVGIIRLDESRAVPRFIDYHLRNPQYNLFINNLVAQSAQPNLNLTEIRNLPISLPPLAVQRAIAATLGTLDDKIELNRRMNMTLEAVARALFRSWFVDFDPVRSKLDGVRPNGMDPVTAELFPAAFHDSKAGLIPKGWIEGSIRDIAINPRRGIQPSKIAPNTPYIALEHMPRRSIALGEWDESANVVSGKSSFKKGEILFGKLRPYFHKVGVAPMDGVCSTDILVLAPKSREWFGFLLGHATSDELIQFTDFASTGTKMPRTNWADIASFKVAIPPKSIAAAFTQLISPMLERIVANLHESRTLATMRDTLLPKLLSGEVQVV